ncbi:MAG: NADH-quinone oxidoreductase subunit L, partial [Chloroflexota bacterium]
GLLLGILVLYKATGTFEMHTLFEAIEKGAIAPATLTVAAILVFLGAMGKSAQFPLHVWLPDAMEGPTPVSALIHAATMVAAGVYLVARSFPLFAAAPGALTVVAVVGLITVLIGSTMAIVMTDVKRVIAYSTVSKLGFMMLTLGFGGLTAAMFFLMTHAFFKALLFLGAGSVIHGTGGKQDVKDMGGLARKMPLTATVFIIASLALVGIPPLSGFWSKDEAMAVLAGNPLIYALALLSVFLTGVYIGRLCLLVFFGTPRDHHVHEHAHEAPLFMAAPMLGLAFLSVVAGFVALDAFGPALGVSRFTGIGSFLYAHEPEPFTFHAGIAALSTLSALAGLGVAWVIYGARLVSPEAVTQRLRFLYDLSVNKYHMDTLYQALINRVILVVAGVVALFDRAVVNDVGVNAPGRATVFAGLTMRFHETGKLYNYGLAMTMGALLLIAAVVILV